MALERRAQVLDVRPECFAFPHADVEDFAGVASCCQSSPALARCQRRRGFLGRRRARDVKGKHPRHVRPEGGARAFEKERAFQFVGHERVVSLALAKVGLEQVADLFWPWFFVVSTGASGRE